MLVFHMHASVNAVGRLSTFDCTLHWQPKCEKSKCEKSVSVQPLVFRHMLKSRLFPTIRQAHAYSTAPTIDLNSWAIEPQVSRNIHWQLNPLYSYCKYRVISQRLRCLMVTVDPQVSGLELLYATEDNQTGNRALCLTGADLLEILWSFLLRAALTLVVSTDLGAEMCGLSLLLGVH